MLLFQTESTESGLGTDPTGKSLGLDKMVNVLNNALKDAFDPSRFQTFFLKLEDQAVKTSRSLSAGIQGYSQSLEKSMMNVYSQTVKIGGSTKDVIDYAEAFAAQTGRVPMIQEEVIVNAVKISKEFGISTKEVAAMAGEFTKVGLSQMAAVKMIRTIGETSRKYGVKASQLTKAVQENVRKSAAYTFKDGIEGLTKMAAKAQSMGVSFDSAFEMYDKFLDPDKAIEFATQMQMMGGDAAAQFGDPMRNMSMSVEEINEGLKKSVSSQMELNAETGRYQATKEGQRYIRFIAEQTGESVENLTAMNARTATLNDMLKDTKFNLDVSDEDKEILASRAQKMGGTWKVQIPTLDKLGNVIGTELKDVSKLTSDEIKKLGESEKEIPLSDDKLNAFNERFISTAERQIISLNALRDSVILMEGAFKSGGNAVKSIADLSTAIQSTGKETLQQVAEEKKILDSIASFAQKTADAITTYIGQPGTGGLKDDIKKTNGVLENLLGDSKVPKPKVGSDIVFPSGGAPVVMSEDEIYQGIKGDQILMGTNLDKGLDAVRSQQQTLANIVNSSLEIGTPKSGKPNATLQNVLSEKSTKLQEVVATTNNNINVSGGANVSGSVDVKVTGNGINLEDPRLSSLITKKVSEMIEQRLSKSWGEKQGNVQTS